MKIEPKIIASRNESERVQKLGDAFRSFLGDWFPATAIRELATWTRRRWPWAPFSKRRMTVQIEVPGGIGIPGKGENDYDCGPDAIYSQSSASKTIEDGIGSLIASALRTRLRRGGSHTAIE